MYSSINYIPLENYSEKTPGIALTQENLGIFT